MTAQEAAELVAKITHTWRGGPAASIWAEFLIDLDAGTAGTAFIRLVKEEEHTPSIAKFLAVYRALQTPYNVDKPECVWCDGSGWVEGPDRVLPPSRAYPNGYINSQVVPCACKEYGDQARRLHKAILQTRGPTRV